VNYPNDNYQDPFADSVDESDQSYQQGGYGSIPQNSGQRQASPNPPVPVTPAAASVRNEKGNEPYDVDEDEPIIQHIINNSFEVEDEREMPAGGLGLLGKAASHLNNDDVE